MTNRREKKSSVMLDWLGDMTSMRRFLQEKAWVSAWGPVKLINSVLRSLGVVVFANNPLTGLLILAGIFLGSPQVGWATVVAATISVICSKVLGAADELVCDGVTVFNSVLVGCVVTAVMPVTVGPVPSLHYWLLLLAAAAVATCYVDVGLNALMAPTGLPALSIPFNIVAAIGLIAARARLHGYGPHDVTDDNSDAVTGTEAVIDAFSNATDQTLLVEDPVEWMKVLKGTVLAIGQVYGVGTMTPSILIWLAFLLYSPMLSCCLYLGSIIGCFMGSALSPVGLSAVYAGLWGYNSLLTAGGVCYFLEPSLPMLVAALLGAVMAVLVQAAIAPIFLATEVPVLSFPFNVVTLLMLAIGTQKGATLTFLRDRSYPERHLYERCRAISQVECEEPDLERNLNSNDR